MNHGGLPTILMLVPHRKPCTITAFVTPLISTSAKDYLKVIVILQDKNDTWCTFGVAVGEPNIK